MATGIMRSFLRKGLTSHMKAASLSEIKKELSTVDPDVLRELCMRLGKFKKENKELLTYLLFEAHNEQAYLQSVKDEIDEQFTSLPRERNVYFIKKTLRKILRFVNRQINYSPVKETELELRIHFLLKVRQAKIPLITGTVLFNLYQQQLKKVSALFEKLPEDLQADYEREVKMLA